MNRSCQRQTLGFDLPLRRMISAVPKPSAVARMNLRPPDVLLRAVPVRDDHFQTGTVGGADVDGDVLAHAPRFAHPASQGNPMSDPIH